MGKIPVILDVFGALVQKITKTESWMAGGLFSSKAGFSRSQFFPFSPASI